MIDRIPVDELYHTVVVVKDARAMARNYAAFFGITRWKVVHNTRKRLSNYTAFGRGTSRPEQFRLEDDWRGAGEYEFITAEGENPTRGLRFQLVQPTAGLSSFEQFLATRGNGIHSLFLAVTNQQTFSELHQFLAGEGIRVGQSYTIDDAADVYFFDTRKALGGYQVKVVVPRVDDWQSALKVDEEWDFSNEVERPAQTEAMTRVPGLSHFGVVVHDLVSTLETTGRLFGQPYWRGMHWSSDLGTLIDCTNNGMSVNHAYFTAMGDLGKNATGMPWGLEVIQPTFGPSHYKEDFLLPLGEGIHHIDLRIPFDSFEDFVTTDFWWRKIGAPVCMSGWLNKKNVPYPQFQYQDTRKLLGFVSETHAMHQTAIDGGSAEISFPKGPPTYMYDFSSRVEI